MNRWQNLAWWFAAAFALLAIALIFGVAFRFLLRAAWFSFRYVGLPVLVFSLVFGYIRPIWRKPKQ